MRNYHDELKPLTKAEAIELLRVHSGACEDPLDARQDSGFLNSLMSWNSQLNWASYQELMACVKVLGPSLSATESMDREVFANLWDILYLGNGYTQDPNRTKHRLSIGFSSESFQIEQLWMESIGYAMMTFLRFDDSQEAFSVYNDVMRQSPASGST